MLSCGDALIDFLPVKSTDGRDAIVPVVGGSCLNIAVGAARLGAATGFVGGISTDLFGRMIADHAAASQVDLRYATRSEHQTTLAFVRSVGGEPQYAFYDEGTASRNWTYRRGSIAFDEIDAIHVGSTTLIDEKTAAETLAMVEDISAIGHHLIRSELQAQPRQAQGALCRADGCVCRQRSHRADVGCRLRVSLWRQRLCGKGEVALLAAGASLVVVTRGIRGAQAWHRAAGAIEVAGAGGRGRGHDRRR